MRIFIRTGHSVPKKLSGNNVQMGILVDRLATPLLC